MTRRPGTCAKVAMIKGKNLAKELDRRWAHCVKAQTPWEYGMVGRLADQ